MLNELVFLLVVPANHFLLLNIVSMQSKTFQQMAVFFFCDQFLLGFYFVKFLRNAPHCLRLSLTARIRMIMIGSESACRAEVVKFMLFLVFF